MLPPFCVTLVGIAAVAGCGDDGASGAGDQSSDVQVNGTPDSFTKRMAKLLETSTTKQDCTDLNAIGQRSYIQFACPASKGLRKSMAQFKVIGTKTYGHGAVVDYSSGKLKEGAAILLFVTTGREWAVSRFGIPTKPSTGTSDADSRVAFQHAVDKYLDAVRRRDCSAFADFALNGRGPRKQVCRDAFASTQPLAKRLKADPLAKPTYAGGNATYGFFELETKKPVPESATISVAKALDKVTEPYVVLDVAPTPTAADDRRLREQLKQGDQPATSPSRKADS